MSSYLIKVSSCGLLVYHIDGKFGGGKFAKLKPFKLVLTINNLLADLLICQIFFCQMCKKSQFAKLSPSQIFPLYSNYFDFL